MADYRAYTVGLDGNLMGFEPLVCADDAEAIGLSSLSVTGRLSFGTGHASLFVSIPNKARSQNGTEQLSAPSSLLAQSRNRYAASIHPDLPEMQPSGRRDDGD